MILSSLINRAINFVYPNRCGFCGRIIDFKKLICLGCAEKCESEALIIDCMSDSVHGSLTGNVKYSFDSCISSGKYDGIIREGVLNLKYSRVINAAEYLSFYLADYLDGAGITDEIDLITFVPMTAKRKRANGYNHAEIIARFMSRELNKPIALDLLLKRNSGKYQHEQSLEERISLAKASYFKNPKAREINGKTILLCDDIVTTGSTLSECSRILKDMGAKRVYCAALAATLSHNGEGR